MRESTQEATSSATQDQPDAIRRTVFTAPALIALGAGCAGVYDLSYTVFDYFAGEAQVNHTGEFILRLWALGAALVLAGISTSFLSMAVRGSPVPRGNPRIWFAGALFASTLLLSHLVGAWNAMPAFTTHQWVNDHWAARNESGAAMSKIPPQQHQALIRGIRSERFVHGSWLLVPFLLVSVLAARVVQPVPDTRGGRTPRAPELPNDAVSNPA